MVHRKYKDKGFSGVNKKRVSLPKRITHFVNPIFIENFSHPVFANFQRPYPTLKKGEDFPAMKGVLRVLIIC